MVKQHGKMLVEEMVVHGKRGARREEELQPLSESMTEKKIQMQQLLQESIEEMRCLESDMEKDVKDIMKLEFCLKEKNTTLNRAAKDIADKSTKISSLENELKRRNQELDNVRKHVLSKCQGLEDELKEKNCELDEVITRWEESEQSVAIMQRELEQASAEIEKLEYRITNLLEGRGDGNNKVRTGGGDNKLVDKDASSATAKKENEVSVSKLQLEKDVLASQLQAEAANNADVGPNENVTVCNSVADGLSGSRNAAAGKYLHRTQRLSNK